MISFFFFLELLKMLYKQMFIFWLADIWEVTYVLQWFDIWFSFLRAREALRQCLPDQLKDNTFAQVLKDDTTTKRWLAQLVKNLQEGQVTDARGIPLAPQWWSFNPQWGGVVPMDTNGLTWCFLPNLVLKLCTGEA